MDTRKVAPGVYQYTAIDYEMLTAKLPFTGSSPAELMKARLINPPIPPRVAMASISPQLQEALYRALEKDPRNRYARAHDFAQDLKHLDQVGIEKRPEMHNWNRKSGQPLRRILFYAFLLLLPAAILGIMVLITRTRCTSRTS